MKIIVCRLPDGSVERISPVATIVWWLQAGRSKAEIDAYVEMVVREGTKEAKVRALVDKFLNPPPNPTPYQKAMRDGGLTEDEAYQVVGAKDCPTAVERLVCEPLPQHLLNYRDSCGPTNGELKWDMHKAREHHRNRMRHARKPLLEALDVEYQRADEDDDQEGKKRIARQKKRLRDCTRLPEIDQASTIEDLIKVWPEELK
jgi:hypothetical protein